MGFGAGNGHTFGLGVTRYMMDEGVTPGVDPEVACPIIISGSGGQGFYNINAGLGNPTGAIIVSFNPASYPDRMLPTYDGVLYDEGSSSTVGYIKGLVGGGLASYASLGDGTTTFTGTQHHYNPITEAFESSGVTVDINDGNPYAADEYQSLQHSGVASSGATNMFVIPKPNASPQTADLVVEGPLGGTAWQFQLNCAKPLQARPATVAGAAATTMGFCSGDSDITMTSGGSTTVNLHQDFDAFHDYTTTNGGFTVAVGDYIFAPGLLDGTKVTAVNVGGDKKVITVDTAAVEVNTGVTGNNQDGTACGGLAAVFVFVSRSIIYVADTSDYGNANCLGSHQGGGGGTVFGFTVGLHDQIFSTMSGSARINGTGSDMAIHTTTYNPNYLKGTSGSYTINPPEATSSGRGTPGAKITLTISDKSIVTAVS